MKLKKVDTLTVKDIAYANADYTGGGCYVFYGRINGYYFFSTEDFGLILDEFPDISDEKAFDPEWQEKHTLREVSEDLNKFNSAAIEWIISHKPNGNYLSSELETILRKIRQETESVTYHAGYIPSEDRTVIFKTVTIDGRIVSETVSGWYFGEVDPQFVEEYKENATLTY